MKMTQLISHNFLTLWHKSWLKRSFPAWHKMPHSTVPKGNWDTPTAFLWTFLPLKTLTSLSLDTCGWKFEVSSKLISAVKKLKLMLLFSFPSTTVNCPDCWSITLNSLSFLGSVKRMPSCSSKLKIQNWPSRSSKMIFCHSSLFQSTSP